MPCGWPDPRTVFDGRCILAPSNALPMCSQWTHKCPLRWLLVPAALELLPHCGYGWAAPCHRREATACLVAVSLRSICAGQCMLWHNVPVNVPWADQPGSALQWLVGDAALELLARPGAPLV
jgi:hypothetical protein